MQLVEKTVSNLVADQFPAFYREEGPQFVEFVKAYYEWMEESGGATFHARRALDYRDVDSTIDDFLGHFRSKYLSSIQFETAVNTRRLVKHALDIYRSKGTERSLDLFFKSVYGVPSSVYYPGDDVFKASDGEWVLPRYLELYETDDIRSFIGLQVEGIDSGATAFVEKYIKKRSAGSAFFTHLYYINNIVGEFRRGEKLRSSSLGTIGPIIRGSVRSLAVIDGGLGYEVGDIVPLTSAKNGVDALARVSGVSTQTGKVTFTLINGGWGYNSNSQVLIAERMLRIDSPTYDGSNFHRFETVAQPQSVLTYANLVNGPIETGMTLVRIDPDTNTSFSTGTVTAVTPSNSTAGSATLVVTAGLAGTEHLLLTEDSNELTFEDGFGWSTDGDPITYDGKVYQPNTSLSADVVSFVDATATGNVIKWSANLSFTASLLGPIPFANGEVVVAVDGSNNQVGNGTIGSISTYDGSNVAVSVLRYDGYFQPGGHVWGSTSGASANLTNVTTTVGVTSVSGEFRESNGANLLVGLQSNVQASVVDVGSGFGGAFVLSNTFSYEDTFEVALDLVEPYLDVELDAPDYGFPSPGVANSNTIIGDALTYANVTAGKITGIIVTNNGDEYDNAPFVVVYDPLMRSFDLRDYIINTSNVAGTFQVGEVVTQNTVPRGIVKAVSGSDVLYLERISYDPIVVGGGKLVGSVTSAEADVTQVLEDVDSEFVGINANVISNTAVSVGAITSLEVVDSGFAYDDGENVTFALDGRPVGLAEVDIDSYGTSTGYWRDNNSELSAGKHIHDGDYWQEFSYEIQSSITLDRYVDVLKSIMHIAGTRHFSRFIQESTASVPIVTESEVTVEP